MSLINGDDALALRPRGQLLVQLRQSLLELGAAELRAEAVEDEVGVTAPAPQALHLAPEDDGVLRRLDAAADGGEGRCRDRR